MHHVIKVFSLAIFVAIGSACTETDVSLPEPSGHTEAPVSAPLAEDERHLQKRGSNPIHQDKTEGRETRSAQSHTHGGASLAIVLEGSRVTIEFDTPLYNLLGFEHKAETVAQKAAVHKAESVLSNASPLFVFNSEAGCFPLRQVSSVELGLENHDDHDDHDDHDEDGAHDEVHEDVMVQYDYKCRTPKALKNVTVNLFEHFENLTDLDLVYLGPNTQKQAELNAAKSRMNLTR